MDRYGITSDEKIQVTSTDGEASETTVSALLKQGSGLNGEARIRSVLKALMQAAGDVAYRTTDGRNSSYAQTQSYTNNLLHTYILGTNQDGNQTLVYQATKVNDGAITEYHTVWGIRSAFQRPMDSIISWPWSRIKISMATAMASRILLSGTV